MARPPNRTIPAKPVYLLVATVCAVTVAERATLHSIFGVAKPAQSLLDIFVLEVRMKMSIRMLLPM